MSTRSLEGLSPSALKDTGRTEAIPYLIQHLSSSDRAARCQASTALIYFAEGHRSEVATALPALLEMAGDEFFPARRHALLCIDAIKPDLNEDQKHSLERLLEKEDRETNRNLLRSILDAAASPTSTATPVSAPSVKRPRRTGKDIRIGIGHLFTTGSNLEHDEIFHVGGAVFTSEHAPRFEDWIVNPGRRITKRLWEKSRISNKTAESSAGWAERRREVHQFFGDLDVLFVLDLHQEQQCFRQHVLRGMDRQPLIIDLHEVARFFLPDRSFFDVEELIARVLPERENASGPRLRYLVLALGELLQDVLRSIVEPMAPDDTTPLVLTLLDQALQYDKNDAFAAVRDIAMRGDILWTDDLMQTSIQAGPLPPGPLSADRVIESIKNSLPPAAPLEQSRAPESTESSDVGESTAEKRRRLLPENVTEAFSHLQALKAIEPRDSQLQYADFIGRAIDRGGRYAIEAGTGTGKTLGYLIPAAEMMRRNAGRKVVVATATKNLQTQLIPEFNRIARRDSLFQNLTAAVLKGKSNYICLTRLHDLYREYFETRASENDERDRLAWLHFAILCIRCEGDLEQQTISQTRFRRAYLYLYDDLNAQNNCTSGLCRHGSSCIYPRVQARALRADLVVTNHHKLAHIRSDLGDQAAVCIIDEADQFPDNFRSSVETRLGSYQIEFQFLNRIVGKTRNRRGFIQVAKEAFEKEEARKKSPVLTTCITQCDRIVEAASRLGAASGAIAKEAAKIKNKKAAKIENGEARWQKLPPESQDRLHTVLDDLTGAAKDIAGALDDLLHYSRAVKFISKRDRQILRYRDMAAEIAEAASTIHQEYPSDKHVHVISGSGNRANWELRRIPMDLSALLENAIYRNFTTTVFTSATLYADESLDLFRSELSIRTSFDGAERLPSPFDFQTKVKGAVAPSVRPYCHKSPPEERRRWVSQIAGAIAQLVLPVYGRSLVLFTSIKDMEAVMELARPMLEGGDIEVLMQNGASALEISTFRSVEYSVLFGVDRFWTGVDFPGPTLSQVIIVRVPNPNLSDPLVEHRQDYLGQAFWESFYGPIARLRLRQGFGRLIRNGSDRGLFVILDSRIVTNKNFHRFETELPIKLIEDPDIGRANQPSRLTLDGLKYLGLTKEFEERAQYTTLPDLSEFNQRTSGDGAASPAGNRLPAPSHSPRSRIRAG